MKSCCFPATPNNIIGLRHLFTEDVTMASPALKSENRRGTIRRTARVPGIIYDGSIYISCRLENISVDGARLRLSSDAEVPPAFTLMVPSEECEFSCSVSWRDGALIGVQF